MCGGQKAHRAFNQQDFETFWNVLKSAPAWRKYFFDTLGAAAQQQPLWQGILLALLAVLALLVGDAAAGLASGLARGLALAAAAVLGALAQVAGLKGLDSWIFLFIFISGLSFGDYNVLPLSY